MSHLFVVAQALLPGKSCLIPRKWVVEHAEAGLTSKLFDSVRDLDLKEVVDMINREWAGLTLTENPYTGDFTLHHEADRARGLIEVEPN